MSVIAVAVVAAAVPHIVAIVTLVVDPVHIRDRDILAIGMCIGLTRAVRCHPDAGMSAIATILAPLDV